MYWIIGCSFLNAGTLFVLDATPGRQFDNGSTLCGSFAPDETCLRIELV